MILNDSYEYRLIDAEVTYLVGLIPNGNEVTKNFISVGKPLENPHLQLKDSNGEIMNIKLIQIKSEYIASASFGGYLFGLRLAPMKNDNKKHSLYIRKII
ncbi:MAG: hypothetical protein O9264_16170 [Leptospira sp.]|nr:hypothetical protein [Leptospira sp.]